ncbi:unnamed protein product [Blumeria hordei]|uniref:Uncharacterized protein n=1 Tax=Blumeria hordei TaxID=2867405 RepID=A0A383ULC1_BLUHO|nr:unnamed protein product [Blumeria hordei]
MKICAIRTTAKETISILLSKNTFKIGISNQRAPRPPFISDSFLNPARYSLHEAGNCGRLTAKILGTKGTVSLRLNDISILISNGHQKILDFNRRYLLRIQTLKFAKLFEIGVKISHKYHTRFQSTVLYLSILSSIIIKMGSD